MTKLSEEQIVRIFRRSLSGGGSAGEDVEVFGRGPDAAVASVDTLVESTDVPPGMRASDIARKSVAACISDFAAKGVRPRFGIVSVTIPGGTARRRIAEMAGGIREAAEEFNVRIIGGDTNEGRELSISVSLYGTGRIVARRGAKKGDRIFATGSFGNAAAGLHLLLKGKRPRNGGERRCLDAFCRPRPKLEFGIRARGYISSSMDSSDGLARTLNEMSRQSKRRFVVSGLPCDEDLGAFAGRHRIPLEDLVLFGGEEYESVFTVPEGNVPRMVRLAKKSGVGLVEIGFVDGGSGVELRAGGRARRVPDRGWSHFG